MIAIGSVDLPAGKNAWVARADGNASDAANWSENRVPLATDEILLDLFSNAVLTWDAGVNDLPTNVASWTQTAAYTNRVTIPTLRTGAFTAFVVDGNAVLEGGSWWRAGNASDDGNTAKVWLNIVVGGDLTAGEAFVFDGENAGYPRRTGFSAGADTAGGAAHGGLGGAAPYGYGTTYGSCREPDTLGSGSYTSPYGGGGAILLKVLGDFVLDGTINANGAQTGPSCGAAGGSVWIQADTLSGAGVITAWGGNTSNKRPGGGGGRIAIHLADQAATFTSFTNAFAGAISARGGSSINTDTSFTHTPGAAGTVYVETPADNGVGHLRLVNGAGDWMIGSSVVTKYNVWGDATIHDETWNLASLVLAKAGRIGIAAGATLHLPTYAAILSDGHAQNAIRFDDGGTLVSDIQYENLVVRDFNVEAYGTNTFAASLLVRAPAMLKVDGEFTLGGLSLDGIRVPTGTHDAASLGDRVSGAGTVHVVGTKQATVIVVR
jgi:hypothetical protein